MKLNKWTMALAAAGVVSLSSVAHAQEAVAGASALAASTTLSGYVSTSYTLTDSQDDADSFRLDVVDLKLASAQGEGEYATGYTVELWAGPDAETLGTTANADSVELLQANMDVRVPVGNGLDLKIGQFTTIIGRESLNRSENAFYTRSEAWGIEPTHHTGILGSYQASDDLGIQLGLVNDTTTAVTNEDFGGTAYLIGATYTMPDSAGFLGGTGLTYARLDGANSSAAGAEVDHQYLGVDVSLGSVVEGLSYSLAWDIRDNTGTTGDDNVVGHYLTYAVNDTTTVNVRYETGNVNSMTAATDNADGLASWTIGVDRQIWENVISRVEFQSYDSDNNNDAGSDDSLTFNLIYSF